MSNIITITALLTLLALNRVVAKEKKEKHLQARREYMNSIRKNYGKYDPKTGLYIVDTITLDGPINVDESAFGAFQVRPTYHE